MRNVKKDTFLFYEGLADRVTLIDGDLGDKGLLQRIISEEQINYVYHLAAQVEIGVGITNPLLTFETNIKGTYYLLEAIRQCPQTIKSVVIASTDKSYGSYGIEKMPYKEDYPLIPVYPYDVSKACADMIARSYASDLYQLPIVITRFCNIYGPGQLNFSALLPDAIRSALGYTTFIPRGNGEQIRDFIYIDDVVDLYVVIGEQLAENPSKYAGEVFNAGTNSPVSVRKVVEDIYSIVENYDDLAIVIEAMKSKKTVGEIEQQYMDFEKVNAYFGWEPRHTLREGMMKNIDWYKGYLHDRYNR